MRSVFAMCFVIFVGVCLFVCLKQTGRGKGLAFDIVLACKGGLHVRFIGCAFGMIIL